MTETSADPIRPSTLAELTALVGTVLGTTDWLEVTQQRLRPRLVPGRCAGGSSRCERDPGEGRSHRTRRHAGRAQDLVDTVQKRSPIRDTLARPVEVVTTLA